MSDVFTILIGFTDSWFTSSSTAELPQEPRLFPSVAWLFSKLFYTYIWSTTPGAGPKSETLLCKRGVNRLNDTRCTGGLIRFPQRLTFRHHLFAKQRNRQYLVAIYQTHEGITIRS